MDTRTLSSNELIVIEMQGVTKVYQMGSITVNALRGVSLRVRAGEFVALMGQSGSGKSTLLHLLSCLDTPTQGLYRLEGRDVKSLSDDERALVRNERVGIIFQDFNLLPRLDALENVTLPLLYRAGVNGAGRKAEAALVRVGLEKRLRHRPAELSGGERQRVAIARALVTDPALILADEPTGNLDSVTGEEILGLLASLHREGRTILMVTHSEHASSYAERVISLRDGQIIGQEAGDGVN
ncbi:MAG: ATP-binding cassette domain-containing protein [Anaerolineales bacterium]|nr:ATP-binding cassette domain-containing protein [Anaerolineales bacterium]